MKQSKLQSFAEAGINSILSLAITVIFIHVLGKPFGEALLWALAIQPVYLTKDFLWRRFINWYQHFRYPATKIQLCDFYINLHHLISEVKQNGHTINVRDRRKSVFYIHPAKK